MKKLLIISMMSIILGLAAISSADVTQNDRLLQRPEWDGAVVQQNWVDGTLRFQQWDTPFGDADAWTLGPTFITSLPANRLLEIGGRFNVIRFDPDDYSSENGLGDIELWGKYQFIKTSEYMLSAGLLVTLPTGSEDVVLPSASGEVNVEVFAAGRFQASRALALIAHVGARQNSDMDVDIGPYDGELDGELQFLAGGGVVFEVAPQLNLQGEINFATEAYDEYDNDIQFRVGFDYEIRPDLLIGGGTGIGLDDGAPEVEVAVRCAFLF